MIHQAIFKNNNAYAMLTLMMGKAVFIQFPVWGAGNVWSSGLWWGKMLSLLLNNLGWRWL
jgi:hypothetical protein